jgi:hypothetical protein
MGFKMMWQNVLRERDPYKQNSMIKDIMLLQPYLSAYYESTKLVIGDKQQQKSEYQEFLDNKQLQNEDSRNLDHKEYNNNNAKF